MNMIYNIDPAKYSHHAYKVIQDAYNDAIGNRHEFFTPEHILYRILHTQPFGDIVRAKGYDVLELSNQINDYIVENVDRTPLEEELDVVDSVALQGIFNSLNECLDQGIITGHICVFNLMIAMFEAHETNVSDVLYRFWDEDNQEELLNAMIEYFDENETEAECTPEEYSEVDGYVEYEGEEEEEHAEWADGDVAVTIHRGKGADPNLSDEEIYNRMMNSAGRLFGALHALSGMTVGNSKANANASQPKPREPWEQYVTCISDTYKNRTAVIGRKAELERTLQILCRADKHNPIYVGEAGVGKTAMIYALAAILDSGEMPRKLEDFRIYELDLGALTAGTSYHGELEKRVKEIMDGLRRRGKCILYIDEIHTIMAASKSGNGPDISSLLKPYLDDKNIRFVGSTTYKEYNRNIAADRGFARRFQQIDILEPSIDEAVEIIDGILHDYEISHSVKYDKGIVRYVVEKSSQLIADRFLPDKAIDIIDEAGAYRELHLLHNKKGEVMSAGRQKVGKDVIDDILAKVCKVNAKALLANDNTSLATLDERISSQIFGQADAVTQVVRAVKMSRAGLIMGDKPLASLLFVGPTGVGKTEVCKVLAKELGIELVRFDMSEYTEKHTVAKLIGSPAGYVGYEDGGLLTDAIRKSPNCVLLLDEIEKAHSDIYNILLQVMDYARLTDNRGNKADFRNVILIMTSNAGAQHASQASVGFGGGQTRGEAMLQSVKKTFKPEFINRLSGTVVFRDMDEPMANLILDKKLAQLNTLLAAKGVTLTLTDTARQHLLRRGFTPQYGAREMDRVIQSELTPLLMDEILFGRLAKGGEAKVDVENEVLRMTS